MIVGVIVVLGGVSIYHNAENYLTNSFNRDKLTQTHSITRFINPQTHQQLASITTKALIEVKRLRKSFAASKELDDFVTRIFSVNYQADRDKFVYAIDPYLTKNDSILITLDDIEIQLVLSASGKVKFFQHGKVADVLTFESKVPETKALHTDVIRLKTASTKTQVLLNGVIILTLDSSEALSAHYRQIVIDKKHTQRQTAKVSINNLEKILHYQFVPKGQPLHRPGAPFSESKEIQQAMRVALEAPDGSLIHNPSSLLLDTQDGRYFFAPIKHSSKAVGLLVLQVKPEAIKQLSEQLFNSVFISFSLLCVFLMGAAIFFARLITSPLEQLTQAIARLIQNDFNFKLSAKKFGSFVYLANQFNMMLTRLQKSRSELIQINKAYSRFVPHQLLKQLSSSGVTNITLGNSCERKMTIMFCDIRGFTSLSESMSPAANFRFINRYLNQIAPVINKHGGIIDKYMGDGIMALFPNNADEALIAAIEMLESLAEYNKKLLQKKLPILDVGVGLHTGNTMLGTVGTPSRMDATVISDTVNAAARVESMTKAFCTNILITEETKLELKDLTKYRMRYIAACQIQGKSKPVTLYEVYDNDPFSLQKEKARNQPTMIKAWRAYREGDSALAIQMYQRLIEKSPNDKSLLALIERCQSGRL